MAQPIRVGDPTCGCLGGVDTIATYDAMERNDLMELARSFDEMPRRPSGPVTPKRGKTHPRPGDEFNIRTTWPTLLEPEGWVPVYTRGAVMYWRRPGKL